MSFIPLVSAEEKKKKYWVKRIRAVLWNRIIFRATLLYWEIKNLYLDNFIPTLKKGRIQ